MNTSTKAKIGLALYIILSVLSLVGCDTNNELKPIETVAPTLTASETHQLVPDALPGEDELIVYPGATDIARDEKSALIGHSIQFTSPDTIDKVFEFYKTIYIAKGWQTSGIQDQHVIFWKDDTGVIPWNASIHVYEHGSASVGMIQYEVDAQRIADPDNVPVIQGASNVRAFMAYSWLQGLEDLQEHPARVITYTTTLSAADVLDAYKYHMPTYGWRLTDEKSNEIRFGPGYGYGMSSNQAVIETSDASNGMTQVMVGAGGADLHVLRDDNGDYVYGPQDAYTPPVARIAHMRPPPPEVPPYPNLTSTADLFGTPYNLRSKVYTIKSVNAWNSMDTPEQVTNFYVDTLSKQGWKQVNHPKLYWSRFIYDTGPTCQTRLSLYLVVRPAVKNGVFFVVIMDAGCDIISGDD